VAVVSRASALSAGNSGSTVNYRAFKGSSSSTNPSGATLFSDAPLAGEFAVVTADLRLPADTEAPGTISSTTGNTVTLGQYVNCY